MEWGPGNRINTSNKAVEVHLKIEYYESYIRNDLEPAFKQAREDITL